jgi:hypothetical protein
MQVHDDIEDLRFLLGKWRGSGEGVYPTIEPFSYTEEITFTAGPGKPFVAYTQRTWRAGTGEPLHSEAGYVRGFGTDAVELVIAQPTGIAEVHSGVLRGTSLVFEGAAFTTATARSVSATRREIDVDGNVLEYRLAMEAVEQPLQHHLSASLRRVDD